MYCNRFLICRPGFTKYPTGYDSALNPVEPPMYIFKRRADANNYFPDRVKILGKRHYQNYAFLCKKKR